MPDRYPKRTDNGRQDGVNYYIGELKPSVAQPDATAVRQPGNVQGDNEDLPF